MKKMIGKEIMVRTDGMTFRCVVMEDEKDRFYAKDKKGNTIGIMKNNVAFYMLSNNDVDADVGVNTCGLRVIACCTPDGVDMNKYYITHEPESDDIYEILCNTLELKPGTFTTRDMGDLFAQSPKFLMSIFSGTVYGGD